MVYNFMDKDGRRQLLPAINETRRQHDALDFLRPLFSILLNDNQKLKVKNQLGDLENALHPTFPFSLKNIRWSP